MTDPKHPKDEQTPLTGHTTTSAKPQDTETPKRQEDMAAPKHPSGGMTINGKHTQSGHTVNYTTIRGERTTATIDRLHTGEDDTPLADLSAHVDGRAQQFTGVPHSPHGAVNSWDHIPDA